MILWDGEGDKCTPNVERGGGARGVEYKFSDEMPRFGGGAGSSLRRETLITPRMLSLHGLQSVYGGLTRRTGTLTAPRPDPMSFAARIIPARRAWW